MSVRFMLNETSYFGKGAREELAGEINKRGFKKVFLVSDKSLVDAGVTAKIETVLKNANINSQTATKNVSTGTTATACFEPLWIPISTSAAPTNAAGAASTPKMN